MKSPIPMTFFVSDPARWARVAVCLGVMTTALTLAQVLPGANPVNLSIYVGSQLRGGIGGAHAVIQGLGGRTHPSGCCHPRQIDAESV